MTVNNTKPTSKFKRILYIFFSLILIVGLLSGYYFSSQSEQTSNNLSNSIKDKIINKFFPEYRGTYLKLVKKGDIVSAYGSDNGKSWVNVGNDVRLALEQPLYIGLVAISNSTGSLSGATFDNVHASTADGQVYVGEWANKDIGYTPIKGSYKSGNNGYVIKSSGVDSDIGFSYSYLKVNGDAVISARILFDKGSSVRQRAGIMIRDSLEINGRFTDLLINGENVLINHCKDSGKMKTFLKEKQAIGIDLNYKLRKVAHFSEFFILAILLFVVLSQIKKGFSRYKFIKIVVICFVLASLDEFHQIFAKGRTPRFTDILIDTSGAILALLIIKLIKIINTKAKNKSI